MTDFLTHLEEATGKDVEVLPVQSERRVTEAMCLGPPAHRRLQHGVQSARRRLRGLPPVHDDGLRGRQLGYAMEIITHPGSGIEKMEDIEGKQLAFTADLGFGLEGITLQPDRDGFFSSLLDAEVGELCGPA